VAGVCALLLSINPDLTREEVKEVLRLTADKIDPAGGTYDSGGHSIYYGYGRINAFRAAGEARKRRTPTAARRITLERTPQLAIPDFQPAGVTDTIQVPDAARVLGVAVSLEIAHTYRGDLRVDLVGPDGTTAVLHERQGGSADDLIASYTLTDVPALSAFTDRAALGAWTLRVSDHARRDEGVLRRWALTLELAAASPRTEWEAHPGTHIPDDDPAGISSEIEVTESGPLSDIAVTVDITHSWRGDLRVVLETPGGVNVQLHERAGASADDLTQTYAPAGTPALRALVQAAQDIHGTWRLHVSDNEARDIGKLNSWTLTLLTGSGTVLPQGRRLATPRRRAGAGLSQALR
jgi:subtilisin-like proprotein convertase family protein